MASVKFSLDSRRTGYYLAILFFVLIFALLAMSLSSLPANADTLNQGQQFFISSQYDAQARTSVTATLRKISNRAYFYAEDNYWNSVSQNMQNQISDQISALAQELDNRIYPAETQFFGSLRSAGVNGDSRITILLSPLIENAGGYYDTTNEYLKNQASNSNEREMIYLNIGQLNDQRRMNSFLAHEFQHLISFNQKEILNNVSDDVWLNELRSEYAVALLGYNDDFSGSNLERRLQSFINNSSDGLAEWKNLPADYGQVALFGEYLAEHWPASVIADTLKNNLIGVSSLNEALAKNGSAASFNNVFSDWLIANFLNDASINPKFGYTRDGLKNFHVAPNKTFLNLSDDITMVTSDSIKDWQGRWYDVSQFAPGQNGFLKIKFSSPSVTSFYIPYIIFKTDGSRIPSVFNPAYNSDTLYLGEIGKDLNRMVFMPIKKDKISGFGQEEVPISLTISLDRIKSAPQESTAPLAVAAIPTGQQSSSRPTVQPRLSIPDGSLVRAAGDYKVYVVRGNWKRHVISPKIFGFYPDFGFNKVKEIDPAVLNRYRESNLVRYNSSKRVYSVDEAGIKHWLNISGSQFTSSGRSWDSIFVVNLKELNFYPAGNNIAE